MCAIMSRFCKRWRRSLAKRQNVPLKYWEIHDSPRKFTLSFRLNPSCQIKANQAKSSQIKVNQGKKKRFFMTRIGRKQRHRRMASAQPPARASMGQNGEMICLARCENLGGCFSLQL
jgi:hypothetical protein